MADRTGLDVDAWSLRTKRGRGEDRGVVDGCAGWITTVRGRCKGVELQRASQGYQLRGKTGSGCAMQMPMALGTRELSCYAASRRHTVRKTSNIAALASDGEGWRRYQGRVITSVVLRLRETTTLLTAEPYPNRTIDHASFAPRSIITQSLVSSSQRSILRRLACVDRPASTTSPTITP